MSASVASKNLFDLLGNDIEDPDAPPPSVPREVIKNTATSKKRDDKVTPVAAATGDYQSRGGGNRGGRGRGGNDSVFRDRDAGRQNNLSKNTEDDTGAPRVSRGRGGRGEGGGRGGGGGGGGRHYDRHSQTGRVDTDKQVSQGWGANKGASEWDDERAGEDLAHKDGAGVELQDPNALPVSETPIAEGETAEVVPKPEPEEILKTYDEYLTELAQRQADLGPPVEVRRPNEGGSNKKWATAKELSRKEEEEGDYFVGESKDKTRNRERKIKQVLDIEPQFAEPREARGGMRGGRERGGGGGGGNSGKEPRNKHKNSDRAPRGGDYRGQQSGGAVNIADSSAFPSLGK